MSLLSVVVPVYNAEKYVEKCIGSILEQTEKDITAILVDDGSWDDSPCISDSIAFNDERVISIHTVNHGVSTTRNTGLRIVSSKYTTFVDSDDWLEKDYYQKALALFQDNVQLVITGAFINYTENDDIESNIDRKTYSLSSNQALKMMFSENYYKGFLWNKLYLTSLIQSNNIALEPVIGYCEDSLFNTQYILNCKNITYRSEPFYHYRIHGGSAAEGGNHKVTFTGTQAYKEIRDILISENVENEIIAQAEKGISSLAVKAVKDMAYSKKYNSDCAKKYRDTFIQYQQQYFANCEFEGKIIGRIFTKSSKMLFNYFRMRAAIRSILK